MSKTIVILSDGTGQDFAGFHTNILKLAMMLRKTPEQVVWYDPGVGTMAQPQFVVGPSKFASKAAGLAIGFGLKRNVMDAYRFLMNAYEPGDKLAFFGFSRGAYTVRALAGLIRACGLLARGNEQLVPYAMRIYLSPQQWSQLKPFRSTAVSRSVDIDFVGVFDTVSSVFYENRSMPFTASNRSLKVVRHAVSIDERRCYFRQNLFAKPKEGQDYREVWFAGAHSDIGGGYMSEENGPAQIAFDWMLTEAAPHVAIDPERRRKLVPPSQIDVSRKSIHDGLTGAWWLAEYVPKSHLAYDAKTGKWVRRWSVYRGRPRTIPEGVTLHQSVLDRLGRDGYEPTNLPKTYLVEPWGPKAEFETSTPKTAAVVSS